MRKRTNRQTLETEILPRIAEENLNRLPGNRWTVPEIVATEGVRAEMINTCLAENVVLLAYIEQGAFAVPENGRLPGWAIDPELSKPGKEVRKRCVPVSANYVAPKRDLAVITKTEIVAIDDGLNGIQAFAHDLAGKSKKDGQIVEKIEALAEGTAKQVNVLLKENALLERLLESEARGRQIAEKLAESEGKRADAATGTAPIMSSELVRRRTSTTN